MNSKKTSGNSVYSVMQWALSKLVAAKLFIHMRREVITAVNINICLLGCYAVWFGTCPPYQLASYPTKPSRYILQQPSLISSIVHVIQLKWPQIEVNHCSPGRHANRVYPSPVDFLGTEPCHITRASRRIRHESGQTRAWQLEPTHTQPIQKPTNAVRKIQVFNLKVDRQLSREYFTSDAIYSGSAGMTLYYYMCRSWQDLQEEGEPVLAIRISWISRQWVLVFE
jgi:hypothetical protein